MAIVPIEQLLARATDPVAAPAVFGSNCRVRVEACPGLSVTGNETPEALNPVPVSVAAVTVTGALPLDEMLTDCVAGVLRSTLPKATLVALSDSVGVAAFRLIEIVFEIPPEVAVRVTVCAVVTAVAVAVKPALDVPDAIVTEAGNVTALELLARVTAVALVAAPLRLTVQASLPAPESVELPQESPVSAGADAACPVPLRLMIAVAALLLMLIDPLAAPAVVGSKLIVRTALCPGFSVSGIPIPESANPVPVMDTDPMISWDVPEEVSVTVFVVGVFRATVPNAALLLLSVSAGVRGFRVKPTLFETPPDVAVRVTV